mmetsp:Transcript_9598/g.14290  ORF Transcript_9598/g.14290 Transcript_9598/m.14290 type:complete len:222 (-) Transcript_9598:502-1167(-)
MGKLLGAQSRTGAALAAVPKTSLIKTTNLTKETAKDEAISTFRNSVMDTLTAFQSNDSLPMVKIFVSIAQVLKENGIDKMNAPEGLTMEILRYIVYEATEEIGEDKWIAYKEPSEFMDECHIAVYKEGQAPADVLEEVNKGEMPEEVKAQERAMRAAAEREAQRREGKKDAKTLENVVGKLAVDEGLATLNTVKRDRRTIEEIQREMETGVVHQPNKRSRS